jgi:hypothetical protein
MGFVFSCLLNVAASFAAENENGECFLNEDVYYSYSLQRGDFLIWTTRKFLPVSSSFQPFVC